MPQHDWALLKRLFQEAIALSPQERITFLDEAGRRHPDLAPRLRELLASHSEAGAFLETPVLADLSDQTADSPAEAETLHPGDVVNDTYEVQSRLGAGGMGVVYRVLHRGLQRSFAAKVIHGDVAADEGFFERFEREAVALGRLKHPNIVDVTDYGVERGGRQRPYLIMECLEGLTLGERLRSGPLPPEAAIAVLESVAAGLDYAHSQGVLHLDLKPANVFLHEGANDAANVKILDFGLAQFTTHPESSEQRTATLAGTPAYLAPELLDGKTASPAADIYAFGSLMYETLVGRPPFEGSVGQVLDQQRRSTPTPPSAINPAIPPDLDRAVLEVLAKDPAARPPSALAAVSGLRDALLAYRQREWQRREMPRRALVATAIGVAFGAISPLIFGWSPVQRLESLTVDARYAAAPTQAPSGRVLLLMLDDASLAADPVSPVQKADEFGDDLRRVLAAGARSVAVDLLLPAQWNDSGPFTRLVLDHRDHLTLAAYSSATGEVVGPECIEGTTTVALGPERAAALFGFINLDEDEDGVSRSARLHFRDRDGTPRPTFAARVATTSGSGHPWVTNGSRDHRFWIDHRIDSAQFTRVSWKDLDSMLRDQPDIFRDRIVLAGADYAGSGDAPRVPVRDRVPGVTLHATTVETILAGFPVRSVGRAGLLLLSTMGAGLLCSAALLLGRSRALIAIVAASLAWIATAFVLFVGRTLMIPLIAPLLLALAGAVAGFAIARTRPAFPVVRANQ